jgi:hypothetical protein
LLFRQLASSEHSRGSCGSGKTVEVFGKVKDRFFRAQIGQLPRHLPRLLGAIERLQGFFQNRRHFDPSLHRLSRNAPVVFIPGM